MKMKQTSMSAKIFVTGVFLIFLSSGTQIFPGMREAIEQQPDPGTPDTQVAPAILNNSRLRSYYYREYVERHYQDRSRPLISRQFMENWIDKQIIYNTGIIKESLQTLKTEYEVGIQLLERLKKDPQRTDIQRQTKKFFKDFREEAKDLRKKIDFMVSGLDSKPDDDGVSYSVEKDSVEKRMKMVKSELDEAEKLIRNYFLEPTHTIDVRDLAENNMMIRLYRIERILESLEKTDL